MRSLLNKKNHLERSATGDGTRWWNCHVRRIKIDEGRHCPTTSRFIGGFRPEGETRESKAKAYAAEESKKVTAQYIGTIQDLNSKLKKAINK